ncbi:MAG: kelch repeat-containing protein, partial [Longimicrobiales bacterium]
TLFIYDTVTDTWTSGAPLPIAPGADHCNVAAVGGKLYVLGAIRIGASFVSGDTFEYDPILNRWQTVGQMPTPRGASGVAAAGTTIYVAGGLAANGSVNAFEAFDTVTREWTRLPNMPTARDHLTAQAVGGKFYAIAGRVANVLSANEEYDPSTNAWRERAPIPTARGGLASGVINSRIVVFGGEGPSGTPERTYRQNEEYDPAANTWRSLAPMPIPRHGLYGATVDNRIFVPSGGPREGGTYSNVHDAFFLPQSEPPALASGRALHAASFDTTLAPGAVVSLFGERLSQGEQRASRLPLPTQMNAVTVKANGTPLPLLYVGPGQVNLVLPPGLPLAPLRLTVTNAGVESAPVETPPLVDFAPGIFTISQTGTGQGAILIAGTGLIARATRDAFSRAPRRGEVVEIYCTGIGRAIDPLPALVTIGGARAEVLFAGPAPGLAGVFQVNARVPDTSATGIAVPVTLRIGENGRVSNTVTIAVVE